jgi:hypothetical protein
MDHEIFIARLEQFVRSHGFITRIEGDTSVFGIGDTVVFDIPWTRRSRGRFETGYHTERVATFSEARAALGY